MEFRRLQNRRSPYDLHSTGNHSYFRVTFHADSSVFPITDTDIFNACICGVMLVSDSDESSKTRF